MTIKSCEHDYETLNEEPRVVRCKKCWEYEPDCKPSEAKQEPKRKYGEFEVEFETAKLPQLKPHIHISKDEPEQNPMTNIKTPEEIAREIFKYRVMADFRTEIERDGKYEIFIGNLIDDITKAISAERNANAEKIRELEDLRKTSWLLYQDHKAKNVELGAEIIQLRFDNQNLTSQLERAEKLDGDNATIVRTVEAMIDSDKTHIKQLEGDLVAVRANKEAYEKRCAEYIDRVVKLEKQVKDFVSEINNLGGQLNQANTKISSLRMAFKILEDK